MKFKNKYSGVELRFKLKQKLYQKGFDITSIEELLNNMEK